MSKMFSGFLVLLCIVTLPVQAQPVSGNTTLGKTDSVVVYSPDKNIRLIINAENGSLRYTIEFNKITVIEPSLLGISVNDESAVSNVSIKRVQRFSVNNTYPYRGVHSTAINKYNQAFISVAGNRSFVLEVKAFNDGVAFRYVIDNKESVTINNEKTQFILPSGSNIWSQPDIKYYEGKYTEKLIDTLKKGELMGPPVTICLPGGKGYIAITEGGLVDFAGMALQTNDERCLQAHLAGNTVKQGRIITAWRIIEISNDLNGLVNCDMIANVSAPYDKKIFPQGYNTSWIKPGRSVWSWLAGQRSVTLENMKRFTDMASQLGFEYNLVDEGWANWKDSINNRDSWDMMKELVTYSASKGVKIWVWKAYPDRKGIAGINDADKRRIFFKKCKESGVAGVKIDFFNSESQEIIQFYQAALKDAAEYQLMLNFHGANKPTGETRTWPNEMTREGIRGLENRGSYASANTILPFTRYLAGHADYTPVHFGDRLSGSTWAHQVASMIIFTSPFLCLGADPQSILENPAKEIIQRIPSVWDETIVLPQSKINEMVLFARRHGKTWFIAAMNGTDEVKTIIADISFLKGSYKISSLADDSDKQAGAKLLNDKLSADSKITIKLNGYGGYVAILKKE